MNRKETDILFTEKTTYEGKNGIEKTKGIKIVTSNNGIHFYPITLKDTVGNCCINIPLIDLNALDKLINELILTKDDILKDIKNLKKLGHEIYEELNPTDSHDGC